MKRINEEDYEEMRDYLYYMSQQDIDELTIDGLSDMTIFRKNRDGKYKFKKQERTNSVFKIGDKVTNGNVSATVIDTDTDVVCVRTQAGEIEVWNIDDVKKRGK